MENKRAALEVQDHFHRLPEELLLDIFNKVADLESLCFSSLVSKRFSSIISRVRKVTITLDGREALSSEAYKRMFEQFRQLCFLDSERILEYLDSVSVQKRELPAFLGQLTDLESLHVEYKFATNDLDNSSLLMWRANCTSTAMIHNLVAVLPASLHKKTEYEIDLQEQVGQDNNAANIRSQIETCLWLSMGRFTEWLCLICRIIKSHSSLRHVTFADSERQCRLVLKDEQLANVRSGLINDGAREKSSVKPILKKAWIPLLDLPKSGYVMKEVSIVTIGVASESGASSESNSEHAEIMACGFDENESMFGEAFKEILKNHGDKLMTPA